MPPGGKGRSLTFYPEPLIQLADHMAQSVVREADRAGDLKARRAAHELLNNGALPGAKAQGGLNVGLAIALAGKCRSQSLREDIARRWADNETVGLWEKSSGLL